jgi:hypothetical protein
MGPRVPGGGRRRSALRRIRRGKGPRTAGRRAGGGGRCARGGPVGHRTADRNLSGPGKSICLLARYGALGCRIKPVTSFVGFWMADRTLFSVARFHNWIHQGSKLSEVRAKRNWIHRSSKRRQLAPLQHQHQRGQAVEHLDRALQRLAWARRPVAWSTRNRCQHGATASSLHLASSAGSSVREHRAVEHVPHGVVGYRTGALATGYEMN